MDAAINSQRLREAVGEMLRHLRVPVSEPFGQPRSPHLACRTLVTSVSTVNCTHPTLWRSYAARSFDNQKETVMDVILMVTSTPDFFLPVTTYQMHPGLGPLWQSEYYADILRPNPTLEAIQGACEVFGENEEVSVILSLGAGHPGAVSLGEMLGDVFSMCLMYTAEQTHEFMENRIGDRGVYHRFNVLHGLNKVRDQNSLGDVTAHTLAYMRGERVNRELDRMVELLTEGQGSGILLSQICSIPPAPSPPNPPDPPSNEAIPEELNQSDRPPPPPYILAQGDLLHHRIRRVSEAKLQPHPALLNLKTIVKRKQPLGPSISQQVLEPLGVVTFPAVIIAIMVLSQKSGGLIPSGILAVQKVSDSSVWGLIRLFFLSLTPLFHSMS
ncbi:hypothetical protein FRB91_007055 [Serendipita sp. 411]|nr:hypothetical protein FRB91_007055 [Serendipita sp. 411]